MGTEEARGKEGRGLDALTDRAGGDVGFDGA